MNIRKLLPQNSRQASTRAVLPFLPSIGRGFRLAVVLGCVILTAPVTRAGLISAVTEGPAGAPYFYNLSVEFSNGNYYNFSLRSTQPTLNGEVLLNTVASLTTGMSVDQTHYSFGDAVNGITIGSDTNSGFVGNSYWSYWDGTATKTVSWSSDQTGESGRTLSPGQADAWVFGDGTRLPQATAFPLAAPEPGTWMLVGISAVGGLLVRRTRKGRGICPARR